MPLSPCRNSGQSGSWPEIRQQSYRANQIIGIKRGASGTSGEWKLGGGMFCADSKYADGMVEDTIRDFLQARLTSSSLVMVRSSKRWSAAKRRPFLSAHQLLMYSSAWPSTGRLSKPINRLSTPNEYSRLPSRVRQREEAPMDPSVTTS